MGTLLFLLTFVAAQPWAVIFPLVGLAFVDGVLGYLAARKRGETFSWARFADFMQNSVGAHQLGWVVLSVALVYFSAGSAAAVSSLVALAGVNGIVYLKVLADIKGKVVTLWSKSPVTIPPPDSTTVTNPPSVLH